ncbi:30S ribosomal protein S19 [Candidatus Woesearchaeota archaeon]|nr:30S ribosomal protein S19 [Candidatus Woesearchaeota archaeon]
MAEFTFYGKTLEELQKMSREEFAAILPSRQRRSLKRGFTHPEAKLLGHIEKNKSPLETHAREMIILPVMLDKTIRVHNGREFMNVIIRPEMLGHRLGEFAMTRREVGHHAPGIGATRSSAHMSVK